MLTNLILLGGVAAAANVANGFGSADHVILFGLDGLDVRCLQQALSNASIPNLQYFRTHGVYTDKARSHRPASSLPNWATIFYGAGIMFHGVTSNSWTYCSRESIDDQTFAPPYLDDCVVYPDIFSVAKQQKPDFVTAMLYSWGNLDAILPSETVLIDNRSYVEGSDCAGSQNASQQITDEAVALIANNSMPQLMFVYYNEVDACAHESSCFSDDGQAAITSMDGNIGRIFNAVRDAGFENSTVFFFVSDHGRNADGSDHTDKSSFNYATQWLVYGRGIIEGSRELKSAIATEDTSPTVAHVLGLNAPLEWHGRVVHEIFVQANASLYSAAKSAWSTCVNSQCARKVHHKEAKTEGSAINWTMGIISTCIVIGGLCLATFVRFYSHRRGYLEI